jgi:hypothetical protein
LANPRAGSSRVRNRRGNRIAASRRVATYCASRMMDLRIRASKRLPKRCSRGNVARYCHSSAASLLTHRSPMRPSFHLRLNGWTIGAIVSLLMLEIAPTAARASCVRHYTTALNAESLSTDSLTGHFEQLALASALAGPKSDPSRSSPYPTPSPCPGGKCSSAPLLPISPAPSPVPGGEHWGCLPVPALPRPELARTASPAEPASRPNHCGHAVFHPPRFV